MAPTKRSKAPPPSTLMTQPISTTTSEYSNKTRFALAVVISLSISTLFYSLFSEFTTGDLATVAKPSPTWLEVAALLLWRITELGLCWIGGFDAYDSASLTLLSHTPTYLLLTLFYAVRPTSTLACLFIDIASSTVPFVLLRPVAFTHYPSHAPRGSLHNRAILNDPYTTLSITLLASGIYAVLLELGFRTVVPSFLVTHFDGIRDVTVAHLGPAGLPSLLISLLPAGLASREFLFVPSTASPPQPNTNTIASAPAFDPVTATFREHLYENVWGWYNTRERALMIRTAILVVMVAANTVVRVWSTVQGDLIGAIGWAAIWAIGVVGVSVAERILKGYVEGSLNTVLWRLSEKGA